MKNGYSLAGFGILPAGSALGEGQVALANEGAFGASFLSQPLTDYAVGWKTDGKKLEELLEFLAPAVKVSRRFEYRVANNADEFAMVADSQDVRALFGEFQTVKTIGSIVNAKTVSKGLTTVIEKDSEMPGDREKKVAWLKKMLLRAECYRAWSLLNTAATNTAKTWNSAATPDKDVLDAVQSYGDAVGIDANRVLYGSGAWTKRYGAYSAQDAKNFIPPFTPAGVGDFLSCDVLVSKERYTAASGKSRIASANVVLVYQGEKGATLDDPSTLKRFWTPEENGAEWAVYVDETNPKLVRITVAHTSQIATTCSTGVQKITVS